jgi:hypothetical protein
MGQQEMEPRAAIAYARRGAADPGEYRQAAGAFAKGLIAVCPARHSG